MSRDVAATRVMRLLILATVCTFIISSGAGIIAVAGNRWFGSGDLLPFTVYCIPFALLTGVAVSVVTFKITRRAPVWIATTIGFLLGILFGWACTFALATLPGPWFGALSIPALQVWSISAAFVFSSAVLIRRTDSLRRTGGGLALIAAASVLAAIGFRPALSLTTGNQYLEVYCFRYQPGNEELKINIAGFSLEATDIELLKRTGLRGTLECFGNFGSNSTTWPRAKALVIFNPSILTDVSFPQPKRCAIAFVVEGHTFRRIPADAPTLPRQIHLDRMLDGWHIVVEHSSGARSGGQISP